MIPRRNEDVPQEQAHSLIQGPTPSRRRLTPKWWLWAVICMVASFACIVAIIIILFRTKDQPSTLWTLYISLNATIAVFATVAKSALLVAVSARPSQEKWSYPKKRPRRPKHFKAIDEASRGPSGAARVPTGIPWAGLATIGAIITVLALGTDTFIQQLVVFEPSNIYTADGTTIFNFAQSYNSGSSPNLLNPADPFSVDGE